MSRLYGNLPCSARFYFAKSFAKQKFFRQLNYLVGSATMTSLTGPQERWQSVTEASMGIAGTSDSSRPLPMHSSCLCDTMYKHSGSDISLSLLAG
jgi:hypothetical protein